MIYKSKALRNAFYHYVQQITHDAMLFMISIAPILAGLFFRFGIPYIQQLLTKYLDMPGLFHPYYLLIDLFLGAITPVMFCLAGAFVILDEIDDGISRYYAVTPVGKTGYLMSRLGISAVIAFTVSIAVLSIFRLSNLSLTAIIMISLAASILGIIQALLVISLSSNKVEGMAVSKLSGLFFLGLPVPFFLTGNMQYMMFILPSFWIAKYAVEDKTYYIAASLAVSVIWIVLLQRRFIKKIGFI